MSDDTTCYLERSKVRAVLIEASEISNDATQAILREIDALPIFNAGDFRASAAIGGGREAALAKAAQDFIDKVDRGEARSKESYAAFKTALSLPPGETGR